MLAPYRPKPLALLPWTPTLLSFRPKTPGCPKLWLSPRTPVPVWFVPNTAALLLLLLEAYRPLPPPLLVAENIGLASVPVTTAPGIRPIAYGAAVRGCLGASVVYAPTPAWRTDISSHRADP